MLLRYLQLLLLEHVRPRGVEDVVGQLGLAVDVDRRRGFAGQEAVVDFSGALRELSEGEGGVGVGGAEPQRERLMRKIHRTHDQPSFFFLFLERSGKDHEIL